MALEGMVLEVRASTNTGAAAVLAFLKRGRLGKSLGKSASEALIAPCTSPAARRMSRPIVNCSGMFGVPSDLEEVIWLTPQIPRGRLSSGAATVAAITDGS